MLVIAGSDTSGGAGLQADLRSATLLGARALTVATALTCQSPSRVYSVTWLSAAQVARQLDAALAQSQPAVVKIGMIASASIAAAVARQLARLPETTPVVYDPVFAASADGTALWHSRRPPTLHSLRTLLARVTVLTPTWRETATLLQSPAPDRADQAVALARRLLPSLHPTAAVVLKGGDADLSSDTLTDRIVTAHGVQTLERARLAQTMHGTGCSFASALAVELARGLPVAQAAAKAGTWVATQIARQPNS